MSTFLQLCQSVAKDSGTISGTGLPSSVTGQSGRLAKIVDRTAEAWVAIQNMHASWRFLRKEFSGKELTAGTSRYTAASFNLTDHAEWVVDADGYSPVTLYSTTEGVADEGPLSFLPWAIWRTMYGRGSQTANRPLDYTVSPAGEMCFGPVPDASYTVAGEYIRTPQVLAANADEPIMPARFHDVIKWRALILLAEYDEAPMAIATARTNFAAMMADLRRSQLPTMTLGGGPIA